MAKTLYVYLKGGRGDAHVTDLWDGAVPTEEGTFDNVSGVMSSAGREVGDPYRDIHNYTTPVKAAVSPTSPAGIVINGGDLALNGTALVPSGTTPTLLSGLTRNGLPAAGYSSGGETVGPYPTNGTLTVALADLSPQVSDEVAHTKPRQFTKVCTWLVFQEVSSTATYKFRKADVLGWGGNPRSS